MSLLYIYVALFLALERPNVSGTVFDQSNQPVPDANVLIYTAGLRVGISPFCPSCYLDCSKAARTRADGSFLIRSVDPALVFRLLVVKDGYDPIFVNRVDPLRGAPPKVVLKPVSPSRLKPGHALKGRVVDDLGNSLVGAQITPVSFQTTDGQSGMIKGMVDPVSITNSAGEFLISSQRPLDYLCLKVTARGFAGEVFWKIRPTVPHLSLKLGRGVIVTGRVLSKGKPIQGLGMGIMQSDRSVVGADDRGHYVDHEELATDQDGRFFFSCIHPNDRLNLYGLMTPSGSAGAVPVKGIVTEGEGTKMNVGDLELQPAHRLSGRIVLEDGGKIQAHSRVLLSRQHAFDSQETVLDADGRFSFEGIPEEEITITALVGNYLLSYKNLCADIGNNQLCGFIDRDVRDLKILLSSDGEPPSRPADPKEEDLWLAREAERERIFNTLRYRTIVGIEEPKNTKPRH